MKQTVVSGPNIRTNVEQIDEGVHQIEFLDLERKEIHSFIVGGDTWREFQSQINGGLVIAGPSVPDLTQ